MSTWRREEKTHEEDGNGEADEPAHPDVPPMVLVAVDAREGVDKGETEEAEDEQRSKERRPTQVDHVIDVALRGTPIPRWTNRGEDGGVGGEGGVQRREREPGIAKLVRMTEVAGQVRRRGGRVLEGSCASSEERVEGEGRRT